MGDQDHSDLHEEQTRVLLINGQTIILQGEVCDNTISEINSEILEQALQEATRHDSSQRESTTTEGPEEHLITSTATQPSDTDLVQETGSSSTDPSNVDDGSNFLAIFETEGGETQTLRLTSEQAAALGFQIPTQSNGDDKQPTTSTNSKPKKKTKSQQAKANRPVTAIPSVASTLPSNAPPQNTTRMGSSSKSDSSGLISLAPQFVSNNVSYSVKLNDPLGFPNSNTPAPQGNPSTLLTSQAPVGSIVIPQNITQASQQKIALMPVPGVPLAPKAPVTRPIVRLKPASTSNASSAIIRPASTKTTIPKIQATPTSIANLAMSPSHPITSSASMVRVLNSAVPAVAAAKPVSASSSTLLNLEPNGVPGVASNASKPLGSSENPIQLVQHGQTFHSMQPLSQEQLKQIATVLQQKQLDTSRNSKNVLYDATTNTRIIYRVVYPEDLALKKPTAGRVAPATSSDTSKSTKSKTAGRKGRPSKATSKTPNLKAGPNSDDEGGLLGNGELSKGEREERKKILPRTRSGRLSRPPRHMVKDYKRIHHLDFAEPELDDSDGGYSDYQISDSEVGLEITAEELGAESGAANQTEAGTSTTGKRIISTRFRCPVCQKIYLGYRRLARHFEQHPDHGSMDSIPRGPQEKAVQPVEQNPRLQEEPASAATAPLNGSAVAVRKVYTTSRGRGRRRGLRLMTTPSEKAIRRKSKIREFLLSHAPAEVAEVAGSLLAQRLDTWSLLRLRVASLADQPCRLAALISEMGSLIGSARTAVAEVLSSAESAHADEVHQFEVTDSAVAAALNLPCGTYEVPVTSDEQLCWTPSVSSAPSQPPGSPSPTDPTDSEEPLAKKSCHWTVGSDSQADKSFLNTTNDSEKPSDTSINSDAPIDDIVSAELKNLTKKTGIEDFVAPPSTTSSLTHVVDFATTGFSSMQSGESPFSSSLSMELQPDSQAETHLTESASSTTHLVMQSDPAPSPVGSSSGKLESLQFQLPSDPARLDLSGSSIDMDSHLEEAAHGLDFEVLGHDFHGTGHS